MASLTTVPKSTQKKRHYCAVCSNFRGKIVDGQSIVLHKFPADEILRKTWIRRIRTVMKKFTVSAYSRICSAHFVDGRMTPQHNIPSVFQIQSKKKLFGTSSLSTCTASQDFAEDVYIATPLADNWSEGCSESDEDTQPTNLCAIGMSELCASVVLHDYCGQVDLDTVSSFVNKDEQTELTSVNFEVGKSVNFKVGETQTKLVTTSSTLMQTENCVAPVKVMKDVAIQCKLPELTIEDIMHQDSKMMLYTGLPNGGTFHALFNEMDDAEAETARSGTGSSGRKGRPRQLRVVDEFLLVLMRLRLGLIVEDLAGRFHISKSTCSVIINKWIDYLSVKLSILLTWPSSAVIKETMPRKFFEVYPNTRVIIDCTEFFTETPQSLINKSLMYSHYKSHMTYKALLGISPSGIITFVSDLWGGSISDKQLTRSCGILDLINRGDAIMADKGFLIADLTTPRGIQLIIPPFKHKRFSRREVEETRRIANLRIYVEMAMERVKNFRILQGTIPITISSRLSQILKLCAGLSNLQPPLILND